MYCRPFFLGLLGSMLLAAASSAAPVIDPIPAASIPAGKSLIIPITATATNGRPLTYTITSSTNRIGVIMHTNNPFWQLTVAQRAASNAPGAYATPFRGGSVTVTNVGSMTFMLFPEYAPHTVNVFQALTTAGFYNSNTIFHRVISNFMIQGGDPLTNGSGGLVFTYDDEFNPQAMFAGNGQLALANSGPDTDGSQFFVTVGPQRSLDFGYTLFGQLVRGFNVLSNIDNTAVNNTTNNRPLADEIIQTAAYVSNTTDTVLTLTATNVAGVSGTITVVADDGAGGQTTNKFTATVAADASDNHAFIYPNTVTNLVGPANRTLTNFVSAVELDGDPLYWYPNFVSQNDYNNGSNSIVIIYNNKFQMLTYNVVNTNGVEELLLVPATNYAGPVSLVFDVSYGYNSQWFLYKQFGLGLPAYDEQIYTFVLGDTPVVGTAQNVTALASVPFSNVVLATFTNGVPGAAGTNFAAAINWGDNSITSGIITTNSLGKKAVLGSHAYLYPGTYPVYVQAQSAIGASATMLSYVTVTNQTVPATNLFAVQAAGLGTVSPAYTNASLNLGASYPLTATPGKSTIFVNWTDNNGFELGTSTNLTFTMAQGLTLLTAHFLTVTPPTFTLNTQSLKTNVLAFNVQLAGGLSGQIQYSTNLITWATLTNFIGGGSTLTFTDATATRSPNRYYRAVIP